MHQKKQHVLIYIYYAGLSNGDILVEDVEEGGEDGKYQAIKDEH